MSTTISATEANAIAQALAKTGQTTLAAKWKDRAEQTARLEKERHRYIEAAGIVDNLAVHIEHACKDRGVSVIDIANATGMSATALYPLKKGKRLNPENTVKVLRWLGATQ